MIFSIFDPRVIAAYLVSLALAFGSGYLYKAHRARVENAAIEAMTQTAKDTAESATNATDTVVLKHMHAQIRESNARISALLRQIEAAKRSAQSEAHPAPVDCRLPDGLRDELNRALDTAGAEGTAAEVPRRDR